MHKITFFSFVFFVVFLIFEVSAQAQTSQPIISFSGTFQNGQFTHKYFKTRDGLSFNNAEALATRIESHLTTINNSAENTFVSSLGPSSNVVWIGLSDDVVEGQFRWRNGEPFTYSSWGTQFEPNDGANRIPPISEDYVVR